MTVVNETAPETGDEIKEEIVEEEVQETPEDTAGETGEEEIAAGEEEAGEEEKPEPKPEDDPMSEWNKRFDKMEKRNEYLQRKLERAEKRRAQPREEPTGSKPTPDQFENNDDYIEALTDWKVEDKAFQDSKASAEIAAKEQEDDFFTAIDAGAERFPDFEKVARSRPEEGGPTVTGPMFDALQVCDDPAAVSYWLGQNVEESLNISKMSPAAAGMEIGRLDERLKNEAAPLPTKQKTTTTTPTKPVTGKSEVVSDKLNDMSMDDFMAERNKAVPSY